MTHSNKNIYFENLDGLRGLCFLLVFFTHSFHTTLYDIQIDPVYVFVKEGMFKSGVLGVNIFFVLSGFLITYLLFIEKEKKGSIAIFKFWLRRIFRIWPLYFIVVIVGFVLVPIVKKSMGLPHVETAHMLSYFTFTSNFDMIHNGLPNTPILSILWSVAIEEQFYLVWPLLLAFVDKSRYWIIFGVIILGSYVFRYFNNSAMEIEFHTLSCISDMAVGGLGAWLYLMYDRFRQIIQNMSLYVLGVFILLFLCMYFYPIDLNDAPLLMRVSYRLIVSISVIVVVLNQNFGKKSFFRFSNNRFLSRLGEISYGLYCLHFIGLILANILLAKMGMNQYLWQVLLLEPLIALPVSYLLAKISFKYFETPFLHLKSRFSVLD